MHVCLWEVGVCECRAHRGQKRALSPRNWTRGGCELPFRDSGDGTLVLWQRVMCPWAQSFLQLCGLSFYTVLIHRCSFTQQVTIKMGQWQRHTVGSMRKVFNYILKSECENVRKMYHSGSVYKVKVTIHFPLPLRHYHNASGLCFLAEIPDFNTHLKSKFVC